ncbi:Do family serine endopeptidase [Acidisarcina polymorpha]|uniref:Do family serine endopeptidase n=1 Tax=Acidisarcina polymorpha TaxID=2211140 RepID=UPI001F000AB9|nr:Do family serine endopeptidase [Acidisarcina polymorpha]
MKRTLLPISSVAALAFATTLLWNHHGVHAAGGYSAPMEGNSVSALTSLDTAMEAVASHVTPAVVNVAVTSRSTEHQAMDDQEQQIPPEFRRFFGNQMPQGQQAPQLEHGIGSGVIISPDGYIVTNNHVVDGATEIRVTLHDRRILNAKLIGRDKLTDLAVIKVNANDLPSLGWGDSSELKPGQTVLAFGSPFGYLQFSVTRGIISALDRPNPFRDDARKPGGFIQTDAAINPGNSGGPLVDAHGQVIGINTFIISGSDSFAGAGFAIPAQLAHTTVDQIIKSGSAHHGYLGIGIEDVTPENSKFFNLQDADGAIVTQVTPDAPGGRAGLKTGDVIRKLDGKPVSNSSALQLAVSEHAPGTSMSIDILRDGKPQSLSVKLGEYHANTEVAEDSSSSAQQKGKLGLAVNDLTPDVRQQLSVPSSVQGVAVENVRPESPADEAGLQPGDVILQVNRQPVQSAENFVSQVHAAPAGNDLLLLIWSKGNSTYRVIHPEQSNQTGM